MRILLSLLSDQPIPNLLFIREMGREGDKHVFISTKLMEERHKSEYLALGLNLSRGDYEVHQVEPYSPEHILAVLDELVEQYEGATWLVNITGGTKVMSQIAYTVFAEVAHAAIYYWPDSNDRILELHPSMKEVTLTHTRLLNLNDYLVVHGYNYTYLEPYESADTANRIWNKLKAVKDPALLSLLANAKEDDYKGIDKPYLTGQWFEEWLYYKLIDKFQLAEEDIGLSVQITPMHAVRKNIPNREIDVVYVYKNRLYIWECKVYNKSAIDKGVLKNDLFRLSALRNMLGLQAEASFAVGSTVFGNLQRDSTLADLCSAVRVSKLLDVRYLTEYFQ